MLKHRVLQKAFEPSKVVLRQFMVSQQIPDQTSAISQKDENQVD